MAKSITLSVRMTGPLSEFVAQTVGSNGPYENSSEYIRDLIRRDKERREAEAFAQLKAELTLAFAAPDSDYAPASADDVIARHRVRGGA